MSLLTLLAALAIEVLAPAFHYHQFGEATRMARDAGLSALFTCGSVFAVFVTIRAFRREIESGTMEMALAHPVSRAGFFLGKTLGASLAYLLFACVVAATALVIVEGAAIGGELARRTGDIARLYGPCFAAGVAAMLLPLVCGAALNRFARCRFVLSSFAVALALSAVEAAFVAAVDPVRAGRLAPAFALVAVAASVLLAASAAVSVRFRANVAAAAVGVVAALSLPAVGSYYLSDALSNGGSVPWGYVGLAALAAVPAAAFFLLLGVVFIGGRDAA
ncbi:MAG: ABC transporter permease subunit [Kiritimatiellae bacterium]|nr:ABC transporter permease subunit [Kiritimatiellia bacterium]